MTGWPEVASLAVVLGFAFGFALAAIWMRRRFSAQTAREVQATIRAAIQDGRELTPDTVRAITLGHGDGREDFRRGVILIAVALALVILAVLFPARIGDDEIPHGFNMLIAGSAGLPGMLGLARLLLHVTRPKADR